MVVLSLYNLFLQLHGIYCILVNMNALVDSVTNLATNVSICLLGVMKDFPAQLNYLRYHKVELRNIVFRQPPTGPTQNIGVR